ncbi:MAG: glycosyltransferase family 4 protein [Ardenticatenaceae bacterium]|nr:glycosyltransferase family 4 protein [Ardenticatenaceae bacterium]MCB9442665.1 glycosyltransferase family 4 protein [Ardenticatenaceae bacterium]
MTKKVVFVHDTNEFGGIELFMLLLVKYYDRDRFEPMVMVPGYKDPFRSSPEKFIDLVEEMKIPMLRPSDPGVVPGISFLKDVFNIRRAFKEAGADIVHIHTPNPHRTLRITLAARLAGLPLIRSEHLPPSFWEIGSWKVKIGSKINEFLSNKIVPGSDACYEEQLNLINRDPKKVTRSCYGIELDRFNPNHDLRAAKQKLGFDPDVPVVGNIARLSPEKGQKYLIDAAAIVIREFGPVNFIIVGSGELLEELQAQSKGLGIDGYVHFLGFQKDTVPFMEAMDVTVMSSLNEGVSLAMLEFMAMGKPLVSSNEPSFTETVVDGESALLVDMKDSNALADGILCLLKDKALAKRLGKEALRTVHAEFSIVKSAQEQMALYDSVLGISS